VYIRFYLWNYIGYIGVTMFIFFTKTTYLESHVIRLFNTRNTNLNSSITMPKQDLFFCKSLELPIRILGCCNGLIYLHKDFFTLMILNPCTRNFHVFRDAILDWDFFIRYEFGYDASNEDYMVVKILSFSQIEGRYENVVRIYSLKACSWEKIRDFTSGFIKGEVGLFVNGALHWEGSYRRGSWEIVTSDLVAKTHGK